MTKEETTATWQCWLLDAIHKIRYQKQRPNVERVAACIRMHHPQYSNEAVEEHLEQCVKNGSITKVGIHNTYTMPSDFTKKAFKDTSYNGFLTRKYSSVFTIEMSATQQHII